jgi:hypothetical protein
MRWLRRFPNSANNFDVVLANPQELDSVRMNELLDLVEKETHRGLTLSARACKEFRRWFSQPDTPLRSDAYVLLSNWFMTQSGDRHSTVATRCEALWDALFSCRPVKRLSSSAPGRNHAMEPAEFEGFWRRMLAAQGEDAHEAAGAPMALNVEARSRAGDLFEDSTGSRHGQLQAAIHKEGLDCVVEGSSRAVADFLQVVSGWEASVKPVGRDPMTSCPRTIINALADMGNTDENALSIAEQLDPANALNSRMATLGDCDLWHALNYFYPRFHNLVSEVAKVTGMSIGHVQRVLVGERTNGEIEAAIVKEFRRRIQPKDGPEVASMRLSNPKLISRRNREGRNAKP